MKTARLKEWTYEDYLALPDVPGPLLYEVIDGELYRIHNPDTKHQSVLGGFLFVIASYLKQNRVGESFVIPCDVIFSRAPPPVCCSGPGVCFERPCSYRHRTKYSGDPGLDRRNHLALDRKA